MMKGTKPKEVIKDDVWKWRDIVIFVEWTEARFGSHED